VNLESLLGSRFKFFMRGVGGVGWYPSALGSVCLESYAVILVEGRIIEVPIFFKKTRFT